MSSRWLKIGILSQTRTVFPRRTYRLTSFCIDFVANIGHASNEQPYHLYFKQMFAFPPFLLFPSRSQSFSTLSTLLGFATTKTLRKGRKTLIKERGVTIFCLIVEAANMVYPKHAVTYDFRLPLTPIVMCTVHIRKSIEFCSAFAQLYSEAHQSPKRSSSIYKNRAHSPSKPCRRIRYMFWMIHLYTRIDHLRI